MSLWKRWVERTSREVDVRPLGVTRIAVAGCILLDLLRVAQVGMVDVLFQTFGDGGLSKKQDPAWVLDDWIGAVAAGPTAFWTTICCMVLTMLGVGTRPAMLLGILAYAQLGHGYPPGDRAIDRILRLVLFALLFTNAHRVFALDNRILKRAPVLTTPQWAYDLLKYFIALVYICAGVGKIMKQPMWLGFPKFPPLYRIVTDPLAGHLDPSFWVDFTWLFTAGSWFTIVWEIGAFVILTRLGRWWALGGAFMHVGIALTMELGMFSWGMLALYPILWAGWVSAGLDRLKR